MLFLVEGLNCSGKTTWIENNIRPNDIIFQTPWANPLRWKQDSFSEHKSKLLTGEIESDWLVLFDAYAIGVYETMMNMAKQEVNNVYWDRTFISAYAYRSISRMAYDVMVELLYNIGNVGIVFLDTSVDETLERWKKLKEGNPEYKDYAWADNKADAMRIQLEFYKLLGQLSNHGIVTEFVR